MSNVIALQSIKTPSSPGEAIKLGAGLACGFASDIAVQMVLTALMPGCSGLTKLMTRLGVFMIGMKAGSVIEKYVNQLWEDTANAYREAQKAARLEVQKIANQPRDPCGH